MGNSVNRVYLLGNIGKKPELRFTQSGTGVLSFRMATNERFKDKNGEWQERAEWHTVVVWGKRAEGLSTLDLAGQKILVEGRIQTREYERGGEVKYFTEIVANDIVLCGSPRGAARQPASDPGIALPEDPGRGVDDFGDDLPF